MKKIRDLLKKKSAYPAGETKKLDEKTLVRIFLEAAKSEIKNLDEGDIREVKVKNQNLYIKAVHPVVSSELFMFREKIRRKMKEIAGNAEIGKIFI